MTTDPPPVYPKGEIQPELCKKAGATWETADPERDSWLPHLNGQVCMVE